MVFFSINIKLLINQILVSACHPHRKGFHNMWTCIQLTHRNILYIVYYNTDLLLHVFSNRGLLVFVDTLTIKSHLTRVWCNMHSHNIMLNGILILFLDSGSGKQLSKGGTERTGLMVGERARHVAAVSGWSTYAHLPPHPVNPANIIILWLYRFMIRWVIYWSFIFM